MVEVINWSEYNPRMDSKKPSWFRLENSVATSASFFDLDCEQKWLWVVILSLVSQSNGKSIPWNSGYIASITGISPNKQFKTIEIFEKFVRLRVSRNVTLRDSPATDETDETDGRKTFCPSGSKKPEPTATASDKDLNAIFLERGVKEKQYASWTSAYPDVEWIHQEIKRALAWELSKPGNKKKNFAAFVARWLAKGWDTRRIISPVNPQKPKMSPEAESAKRQMDQWKKENGYAVDEY